MLFVTKQCPFFQASCTGEVNGCRNGGTMIWDPVKQFACLCKDGFRGELCEKDVPDRNVLFIMNKTLKNFVCMPNAIVFDMIKFEPFHLRT